MEFGRLLYFGEKINFCDFEKGKVPSLVELREFYNTIKGRKIILQEKGLVELTNTFIRPLIIRNTIPLAIDSRPPIPVEIIHSPTEIAYNPESGLFTINGGKRIQTEIPREGIQIPDFKENKVYNEETGIPLQIEKNWDKKRAEELLKKFYKQNWDKIKKLAYVHQGTGKDIYLKKAQTPAELAAGEISFFWTINENLDENSKTPSYNIVKRRFGFLDYGPWHIDCYWKLLPNNTGKINGDVGYRIKK